MKKVLGVLALLAVWLVGLVGLDNVGRSAVYEDAERAWAGVQYNVDHYHREPLTVYSTMADVAKESAKIQGARDAMAQYDVERNKADAEWDRLAPERAKRAWVWSFGMLLALVAVLARGFARGSK